MRAIVFTELNKRIQRTLYIVLLASIVLCFDATIHSYVRFTCSFKSNDYHLKYTYNAYVIIGIRVYVHILYQMRDDAFR